MVREGSLRLREKEEKMEERLSRRLRQKKKQVRYSLYYYEEEKHKRNNHEGDRGENEVEAKGERHNQICPEKVLWRVTCGTKRGILHKPRLQRGELCIMYNGHWISPVDFETYGGRGSAKKWKYTIHHNNKPLEFFFSRGDLSTKGFKFKKTLLTKDKTLELSEGEYDAHSSAADTDENIWDVYPIVMTDEEDMMEDEREAEKSVEVKEIKGNEMDDLKASVENPKDQPALKEMLPRISAKFPPMLAYPVVVIERLPLAGWNLGEPQVLSGEEADRDSEMEVTDDSSSEETDADVTGVSTPSLLEYVAVGENEGKFFLSGEILDEKTCSESTVEKGDSKDLMESPPVLSHIVMKENKEKSPNERINGEIKKDLEKSREHGKKSTTSDAPQKWRPTDKETPKHLNSSAEPRREHDATKLQDGTPSADTSKSCTQPASPHAATPANVDEMDLDQLKREKLKKQLKVLQLKEEYYTFKLNKLKRKKGKDDEYK